ncbi:hypothetical protein FSP39_016056 [Pinctada imbricata]|uniref:G-protein coupled receptors family 1 profile domain-containing protein n=1 Tax=Pinctada imbricata TaxID=66713 RepID=A0AA88Y0Q3_PINIB|nr:hypothetical protein FSP39_016056 [Pinctada imbricata]
MSKASTRRLARDTRDFKVVKTLVLIVVLFVIMWTPIFSVFVAIQLDGMAENMEVSSQALIVTLCIALCNACANPFIYGIMNTKIKNAITSCLCKKKRGILSDEARNSATVPISAISYHSHNSSNS